MKTQFEAIKETDDGVLLKVAGRSNSSKVAGAIVKYMNEGSKVSLVAMGAGAVNQAVKAIAIARGMAAPQGWNLFCIPGFSDENVDGVHKTAMVFQVER